MRSTSKEASKNFRGRASQNKRLEWVFEAETLFFEIKKKLVPIFRDYVCIFQSAVGIFI